MISLDISVRRQAGRRADDMQVEESRDLWGKLIKKCTSRRTSKQVVVNGQIGIVVDYCKGIIKSDEIKGKF